MLCLSHCAESGDFAHLSFSLPVVRSISYIRPGFRSPAKTGVPSWWRTGCVLGTLVLRTVTGLGFWLLLMPEILYCFASSGKGLPANISDFAVLAGCAYCHLVADD